MPPTVPPTAVLDSEALSSLADPKARSSVIRRAQAVLVAVERRGGYAVVPAPVLAEVSRGRRAAAVNRVVNKLTVVSTDRSIAQRAGTLLERESLGSEHAVDAFVVATAAGVQPAIVLTSDPEDLDRLAGGLAGVVIQALP